MNLRLRSKVHTSCCLTIWNIHDKLRITGNLTFFDRSCSSVLQAELCWSRSFCSGWGRHFKRKFHVQRMWTGNRNWCQKTKWIALSCDDNVGMDRQTDDEQHFESKDRKLRAAQKRLTNQLRFQYYIVYKCYCFVIQCYRNKRWRCFIFWCILCSSMS